MILSSFFWRTSAAVLLMTALAGCDRLEGGLPATQVAAQVNGEEITVHQVNAVLARSGSISPERAQQAKRDVLERLIEQRLAGQQAVQRKLDRSPEVLRALESAKAEILARALAEEVARAQPRPTADEVKRYYAEHPELFAQRRVFVVEEIGIADARPLRAELAERVAKAGTAQEVTAWLKSRGAQFVENRGVRTAEQLPLDRLPQLHAMKDGEMRLFDEGDGRIQVVRVAVSKSSPVDEEAAAPRIRQFLFNRRASEAVAEEMKRIREAATIEYRGEFAAAATGAALAGVKRDDAQR